VHFAARRKKGGPLGTGKREKETSGPICPSLRKKKGTNPSSPEEVRARERKGEPVTEVLSSFRKGGGGKNTREERKVVKNFIFPFLPGKVRSS